MEDEPKAVEYVVYFEEGFGFFNNSVDAKNERKTIISVTDGKITGIRFAEEPL